MTKENEELFLVTGAHFYAGIVFKNDKVITSAPILKYMSGWSKAEVRRYCDKKQWFFKEVETSK